MEIRNFLSRCRHAREELRALRRQMERLGEQAEMQNAQRYRRLLEAREREAVQDLAELEAMIGGLQDPRSRTVMRYYYTMGWNDTQIGEEMDITDEWVRKKRYAAVRSLERRRAAETEEMGA